MAKCLKKNENKNVNEIFIGIALYHLRSIDC